MCLTHLWLCIHKLTVTAYCLAYYEFFFIFSLGGQNRLLSLSIILMCVSIGILHKQKLVLFQMGQHVDLIHSVPPQQLPRYQTLDTAARQLSARPLHRLSDIHAVQQIRWQSIPGRKAFFMGQVGKRIDHSSDVKQPMPNMDTRGVTSTFSGFWELCSYHVPLDTTFRVLIKLSPVFCGFIHIYIFNH